MSESPLYWSPAFIQAFVDRLDSDEQFLNTARGFSETIVLRCFGTPAGEDVSAAYHFEDGRVDDVDLWIDEAPSEELRNEPFDRSEAMARATATYETWVRVDTGEMGVMQAVTSPDYTIEGSMMRIMSNMGIFRGLNEVAAEVEKRYE